MARTSTKRLLPTSPPTTTTPPFLRPATTTLGSTVFPLPFASSFPSSGIDKFEAIRAVLAKYSPSPIPPEPAPLPKAAYGRVALTAVAPLFANLPTLCPPSQRMRPASSRWDMESMGIFQGDALYSWTVSSPSSSTPSFLFLSGLADSAQIFLNQNFSSSLLRPNNTTSLSCMFLPLPVDSFLLTDCSLRLSDPRHSRSESGSSECWCPNARPQGHQLLLHLQRAAAPSALGLLPPPR